MKRLLFSTLLLGCVLLAPLSAPAQTPPNGLGVTEPRSFFPATVDLSENEVGRIQRHLSFVERFLRTQDASHFPAELRRERARNLDRLRDYWVAGQFPLNHDFDHLVPHFIDRDGTACAVAHLMIESGAGELARAVSSSQNYACVFEITEPGVPDWVEQSGLTLEECAMIQPMYGPFCVYVDELTCESSNADVTLSWLNGDVYESIRIYRDGILIAILPGDAMSYLDQALSAGTYSYGVEGDCGGYQAWEMECTVDHLLPGFVRGECNGDGALDIADVLGLLGYLFVPPLPFLSCESACDTNDDDNLDLADAFALLGVLFGSPSVPLPLPYPDCGLDPTLDSNLTCTDPSPCP